MNGRKMIFFMLYGIKGFITILWQYSLAGQLQISQNINYASLIIYLSSINFCIEKNFPSG